MAAEERDAQGAEAAKAVQAHLDVNDMAYQQQLVQWFHDVGKLPFDKRPPTPPKFDKRKIKYQDKRQAAYNEAMRWWTVLHQRWEQINDKRKRAERSVKDAKRDWKSEMQNRMKSKKMSAEERRYRMAAD